MKRILIIIFSFLSINIFAQSVELKNAYQSLQNTFKQYKYQTNNVYNTHDEDHYYAQNMSLTYKYPDLVLKFTEVEVDSWHRSAKPGSYIISIPIATSSFEVKDTWDKNGYIEITNPSGLSMNYKGQTELIERYYLYSTKLNAIKLCDDINKFKKILMTENYEGQLDKAAQSNQDKSQKSTITKKSKSEKYGE